LRSRFPTVIVFDAWGSVPARHGNTSTAFTKYNKQNKQKGERTWHEDHTCEDLLEIEDGMILQEFSLKIMPSDWMLICLLSHMLMFALNILVQKAEVDVQMTFLFFVQVQIFPMFSDLADVRLRQLDQINAAIPL